MYSSVVEKSTIENENQKSKRGVAPESLVAEGKKTPHIVAEEVQNEDDPLGVNHITYVNGKVVTDSEEADKFLKESFSKCTAKKIFEDYEEDDQFNGRYNRQL